MCVGILPAQTVTPTVISSDGGFSAGSQGSIAWTIGEPVSETYVSPGSNVTTMGFHQPEVIELETMIREHSGDMEILVYPNPVKDVLTFEMEGFSITSQLEIYNTLGQKVYSNLIEQKSFVLDLREFPNGIYTFQISENSRALKHFKVIKN